MPSDSTIMTGTAYVPIYFDKKLPKYESTALAKAKSVVKNWDGKYDKSSQKALKSERKAIEYNSKIATAKSDKERKKYTSLRDKYYKLAESQNKANERARKKREEARKKEEALKAKANNLKAIKNAIEAQKSKRNEGHMAIYPTDGSSSKVIFFLASDSEQEDTQTNVTSYPVDKGAPRSNYARISSRTVSISGLIVGENRAEANAKFKQLKTWNEKHTELTFKGDFTYTHLLISGLQQDFSNLRDNLHVTITFTYVIAASIKTSTGKTNKKKRSKSSKTTAGSRNKKYTAITIKKGDTLLGLSKKYGKSVAWLQKVNHIKNPNLIYAGRTLYVSPKKRRKLEKVRVK